jgi:hypothetical protein
VSKSAKWLVGIVIALAVVSVAVVVFTAAHRGDKDEEDQAESVKTPSHVSVENGSTVITLDPQTQGREGIRVAPVTQASRHAELRGTAVLLAVTDLATMRNSYVAARTKFERDQVDLSVSRSQYERTKTLYEQNQNMSLKAMQDAEATYRNNQAQVSADEQEAKLQLDTVRQRWGGVLADWIAGNRPILDPVLEQREFLAQVIFPPGEVAKPPATLSLTTPGNRLVQARFISPLPQVNPQIQGISFLYLVPDRTGLAVGMNLVVLVPVGQRLDGTVVPESAIVWWQGKAWAYVESPANTFTRREVPTDNPVSGGHFVPGSTFPPATKLVTAGAQALFSEEFRSQLKAED